ncbi:NAD(P)+ transhydrogenase beta chain [Agrobacterium vitis]|uniref:NAD(P)+ transhydrogenase beta chain n=1 Tax=Agrobacterium vitis TaxID=373 RepID=UPI0015773435|nr:NAD(P)+ transhydrogenase beta chain [Agrobacterium vitis]
MEKPSYSTTKRALWLSSAMAWAVILILAVSAAINDKSVELGSIALPSMVAIIVGILGIHRGFGSLDMHFMTRGPKPDPPFLEPPAGGQS